MKITADTVRYIADLSGLQADDDIDEMLDGLNAILEYTDTINASVGTDAVAEKVPFLVNVMREDTVKASYSREELLSACPETNGETPVVPKTVE